MTKYICGVCGYVHEGDAPPDKCPQCGAVKEKFVEAGGDMTWADEHQIGVAQGVDAEILEGLRERGHQNVLVCPPGSRSEEAARTRGFDTRTVGMRYDLSPSAILGARRALREIAPEFYSELDTIKSYTALGLHFVFGNRGTYEANFNNEAHRNLERFTRGRAATPSQTSRSRRRATTTSSTSKSHRFRRV